MSPDPAFVALQTALSGRFSIEHELGRGGMGIVYLARDVQLQRQVAIKLLTPSLSANSTMRQRFLREAHLAAQCFHPHIVPIHGVEESGDLAWFVMAYVRGESLAERVRRTGPLSSENVRRLAQDIGWALSYAHERGMVHRDVKPENILIDASSERFLLADFGIAQRHDTPNFTSHVASATAEHVNKLVDAALDQDDAKKRMVIGAGTPRYMAPEQARGDAIDGRADLYALGASLFFAASGRPPFDASSSSALLYQHAAALPPNVRTFAPALPTNLADAIDQCLAKIPDQRFVNAAAFVDAVKPLETQQALPLALLPAHENMDGAKSALGWSAVIGATSVLLMLGEADHSLPRDIIFALGAALSGFMAFVSSLRVVEAVQTTGKALQSGHTIRDAERALTGNVSAVPVSSSDRKQGWTRIGMGSALALAQGHLSRLHGIPEVVEALNQVFLIFAPAYLVGRGTVGVTRGTRFRRWLNEKIEKPIAHGAALLARRIYTPGAATETHAVPDAATEMFLERAVNAAIANLSPQQQKEMKEVAAAATALAHDAERLRVRDLALQDALRFARQEVTDEARTQRLDELGAERLAVQNRLATIIAALETMRLDLLRLETSNGARTGLTTHLGVVRDLAYRVDAAAELRAYLAHSTPTPV
ncbi:MAG: serine/threonine-protein kinase [Gemmatimonadaceae bacterium]